MQVPIVLVTSMHPIVLVISMHPIVLVTSMLLFYHFRLIRNYQRTFKRIIETRTGLYEVPIF